MKDMVTSMQFVGTSTETFILLSGITVKSTIELREGLKLQSADTSHLDLGTALSTCSHPDDIAVVAGFIPRVTAQFQITAETPKDLAMRAWNSSWDALLLSAIFHTEIGFNIQSDTTSCKINAESTLRATNFFMYGLPNSTPYLLTPEDYKWIADHYAHATELLNEDSFQSAVHCLGSYRWHPHPRIKMAVIWAGIEGMFGAASEIRFRISLYIARFLYPDDKDPQRQTFEVVKELYNKRSAAVHGTKIKGNSAIAVEQSADILRKLLLQCIETKSMPDETKLVP